LLSKTFVSVSQKYGMASVARATHCGRVVKAKSMRPMVRQSLPAAPIALSGAARALLFGVPITVLLWGLILWSAARAFTPA
jgi:hypothetical protein